MQKFGLDTVLEKVQRQSELQDIELEILRDQSSALGRAGRSLSKSIDALHQRQHQGIDITTEEALLRLIGQNLHALMIQRELTGFTQSNLAAIQKHYDIPKEALKFLGI